LSRPSGGLVSNSNLTLFVLAAEVRPILHLCRLIERRTLYWQRMVSASNADGPAGSPVPVEILERIESLELLQKSSPVKPADDLETSQPNSGSADAAGSLVTAAKDMLQPQIDALNRAVRRYEKHSAAQAALLDARLRQVDGRAADALALAAAAMRDVAAAKKPKPKPSLVRNLASGALAAAGSVVGSVVGLVLFPWRLVFGAGGYIFGQPGAPKGGRLRSDARGLNYGLRGKGRSLGR
jgi:hypothetical protein